MIVQDVTVLPTFKPCGGPIIHSSTRSKPDSPVHPLFPRLFLVHGLVCNSRATFQEIINSGFSRNTYSVVLNPFTLYFRHQTIAYPLETSYCTFLLCSMSFLSSNSRDSLNHLSRVIYQISNLAEVRSSKVTPYPFVSTMEFPKKG